MPQKAVALAGSVLVTAACAGVLTCASRARGQHAGAEDSAAVDCSAKEPPTPERARCVATGGEGPDPLLYLPRAAFAVPRLVVRTLSQAAVAGAWVEDEYHLTSRATELFFNDERTFGIFPTAFYETGFAPNAGVRVIAKDLAGEGEGLRLRAGFGGVYRQIYEARIDSGRRFDARFAFTLGYARQDNDRFYGLGNADEVGPAEVTPPLDALAPEAAVRTVHRSERAQASLATELPVGGSWSLNATHGWRVVRLAGGTSGIGDTPFVDEIFAPATVVGLDQQVTSATTEVGFRLDDRRNVRADMPRALPGSGTRLDLWTGLQAQPSAPRAVFGRVGLDVQRFVDLLRGDRVLRLRLRGVGVLGDLSEIPFVDLPRLGGATFLRGYDSGRFRGAASLLATAEYRYPVQESISIYVFVDGGRVYGRWQDVTATSLSSARVGFGAGLAIFNTHAQLLRLQLASSIDGGLFLHVQVNTTDEQEHG
jgi:hypothetical protein